MSKKEKNKNIKCDCSPDCNCGCQEGKECNCDELKHNCNCDDCNCDYEQGCDCADEVEECDCGCHSCDCEEEHRFKNKEEEYLAMAKQIQAEFDNYRKRTIKMLEMEKQDGMFNAIKILLPALDAFKKAKTIIADKATLDGINMIECEILKCFDSLGIEKINALGEKYNPNYHNVVAIVCSKDVEDDIVVEEYQTGYKTQEKVLRYSQVVVNKLNA